MIIIYTILFLIYLAGVPIIYSLCAKNDEFVQAFKQLTPAMAWFTMVLCLICWPVIVIINGVYNILLKLKGE